MRVMLEMGERWRGDSGRVGVTPASNPSHRERQSSVPRPTRAPVSGFGHLGPKTGTGWG
jgi:hypothetical protein